MLPDTQKLSDTERIALMFAVGVLLFCMYDAKIAGISRNTPTPSPETATTQPALSTSDGY